MATSWIPQEEEYQKYKMEADKFIWDVVGNNNEESQSNKRKKQR